VHDLALPATLRTAGAHERGVQVARSKAALNERVFLVPATQAVKCTHAAGGDPMELSAPNGTRYPPSTATAAVVTVSLPSLSTLR
jgi:hypothetical protein